MLLTCTAGLAASLTIFASDPVALAEAWVADLGAPVNAAITVHQDRVFAGNQAGRLAAVAVDTGKLAWTFQADGALDGQALVDGDEVFVQSRGGWLYAIARANGRQLWRSATGETGPKDFWDFTLAAPVLHRDSVVLGTAGGLKVYARRTGDLEWQFDTAGPVRGTPALVGDTLYFGSLDGRVTALDLATRETLWQFKTLGSRYFPEGAVQGAPSVAGDLVHIGSRDYNLYVLDRASGRVMWNLRTPSWVIGGPAVDGDRVYFGTSDSHRIYAVDRQSGDPVWKFDTSARVFASPVIHGESVYFASFDGQILGLDASSGAQLWSYRTRGGAANHGLVHGDDGQLAESFLELRRKGAWLEAERRILQLGSIIAAPTLADGRLIFGSTDGHLYALELAD